MVYRMGPNRLNIPKRREKYDLLSATHGLSLHATRMLVHWVNLILISSK
jgi:hypothetical protein